MSKKHSFYLAGWVLGGVLIGLLFANVLACELDPDNDGGAGADFDASLYYTKAEVDALITTVVQDTGLDAQLLAGAEWAERTPVGFSCPSDAKAVLVEIIGTNSSATDKSFYIQFSPDNTGALIVGQFTLDANANYTSVFGYTTISPGSTTLYAWHDIVHSGAATDWTGVDISVRPVVWFK